MNLETVQAVQMSWSDIKGIGRKYTYNTASYLFSMHVFIIKNNIELMY